MSYCAYCEFSAPNHSRYLKHLGTKKHATKYLEAIQKLDNPNQNIVFSHPIKQELQEIQNTNIEEQPKKTKPKRKYQKRSKKPELETVKEENVQEKNISEEDVQEIPFFLDTHMLNLYQFLSNPINPVFLWFIKMVLTLKTLFGVNDKKDL